MGIIRIEGNKCQSVDRREERTGIFSEWLRVGGLSVLPMDYVYEY